MNPGQKSLLTKNKLPVIKVCVPCPWSNDLAKFRAPSTVDSKAV